MTKAPSIKEALEKIATLEVTGGAAVNLAERALATLQPDGERREAIALAEMVYKAIKFTDEAAGEGLVLDGLDPADILCDYAQAIGTDCWDGMAEVARDAILASGLTSVPLVPREAMARMICEQLFGPFDAAEMAETSVSGQARKCTDAILASGLVQDEAGIRKDEREKCAELADREAEFWQDAESSSARIVAANIRSARDGGDQ